MVAHFPFGVEEIETTEHALLRCPARQYARGSFPETLDLKYAWYDATATEMLAEFARRTFTAYPPGFPHPEDNGTPTPASSPSYSVRLGSAFFIILYSPSCFPRVFWFLWCAILVFFSISSIFHLIRDVW